MSFVTFGREEVRHSPSVQADHTQSAILPMPDQGLSAVRPGLSNSL
jgi:hypothetical protein